MQNNSIRMNFEPLTAFMRHIYPALNQTWKCGEPYALNYKTSKGKIWICGCQSKFVEIKIYFWQQKPMDKEVSVLKNLLTNLNNSLGQWGPKC